MSFDYIDFLERHGIEYKTNSPNAGRGEIAIKCPRCGEADPSEHLSINLEGRGWVCRRKCGFRGVSPAPLVRTLLGCSAAEAARIVGAPLLPGAGDVLAQVEGLIGASATSSPEPARALAEPREFRRFEGRRPSERRFVSYLVGRGFEEEFVRRASAEMGLRYCTLGPYAERVIFLVHQEGRLVNWTGRSIFKHARLRYKAHTPDPELAARWSLEPAACSVEGCLLWYDDLLAGGPMLMVVEGPMDALKLRAFGYQVTCLFTNALSRGQVDLLRELAPRFERRFVLLDCGAEAQMLEAVSRLASLGFRPAWLPRGVKDPGDLGPDAVSKIEY